MQWRQSAFRKKEGAKRTIEAPLQHSTRHSTERPNFDHKGGREDRSIDNDSGFIALVRNSIHDLRSTTDDAHFERPLMSGVLFFPFFQSSSAVFFLNISSVREEGRNVLHWKREIGGAGICVLIFREQSTYRKEGREIDRRPRSSETRSQTDPQQSLGCAGYMRSVPSESSALLVVRRQVAALHEVNEVRYMHCQAIQPAKHRSSRAAAGIYFRMHHCMVGTEYDLTRRLMPWSGRRLVVRYCLMKMKN